MMTSLGEYIKETIEQHETDIRITMLVGMPEWEFIIVMSEGFFDGVCAGTRRNGIYYSEHDLLIAYHQRNPGAEPLI